MIIMIGDYVLLIIIVSDHLLIGDYVLIIVVNHHISGDYGDYRALNYDLLYIILHNLYTIDLRTCD